MTTCQCTSCRTSHRGFVTSAEFSTSEPTEDDRFVYRTAKIFRCDHYPEKGFSLNESEADLALRFAAGVPLDVEHIPSIFDGKLGHIETAWRTGKELFARIAFNKQIYEGLSRPAIKLSCTWDMATKTLRRLACVLSPHISDAVMMAAFSSNTALTESQKDTPMNRSITANFTISSDEEYVQVKRLRDRAVQGSEQAIRLDRAIFSYIQDRRGKGRLPDHRTPDEIAQFNAIAAELRANGNYSF